VRHVICDILVTKTHFLQDGQSFFVTLFKAWCHNAVATFSLCLLAQAYEQAYHLLQVLYVTY
jgi:hypothetical protein